MGDEYNTLLSYDLDQEQQRRNEKSSSFLDEANTIVPEKWAVEPIWRLPVISIGVFEGERPKAKAMVKELASVWELLDTGVAVDFIPVKNRRNAGAKRGGRTKMKTL